MLIERVLFCHTSQDITVDNYMVTGIEVSTFDNNVSIFSLYVGNYKKSGYNREQIGMSL